MRDGERLRILRIIGRMNVGGPALQVTGLQRHLDRAMFEQRLIHGDLEVGEASHLQLRAPDVDATAIPGLGGRLALAPDLAALRRLRQEIRAFRPHVVHTHTAKAGLVGRLAALLEDVPVTVHTFHGHVLHGYFSAPMTELIRRIESYLARRTTHLIAVGNQVRDDLLDAGIGERCRFSVFPPGIEHPPTTTTRSEARKAFGLAAEGPVVAFVGRLVPIKRADRFLEAAKLIAAAMPETRFLVAGGGPLEAELRLAAHGASAEFTFLGWRGDVHTVFAAADLVLLTSDNEGMPTSLIEAGMLGRPAVATDVGSVGEVVRDGVTGRLVGASPSELALATLDLLRDPTALREMGNRAREWTEAEFSAARLAQDSADLYLKLVDSP